MLVTSKKFREGGVAKYNNAMCTVVCEVEPDKKTGETRYFISGPKGTHIVLDSELESNENKKGHYDLIRSFCY